MNQKVYLTNILYRYGMGDCKPRITPCETNLKPYDEEQQNKINSDKLYYEMVGSLVYAMICTRPDLSFVVTKLSQNLSKPNNRDWTMLKHVFRYKKGTLDYSLTFRKTQQSIDLKAFCDADWGASCDDQKSITGYCIIFTRVDQS
ncbi:uncharacterized protein LOC136089856 [Hydra vulgaris]|uniref:Uncharacterized protein LOC136089856 n=1 Tax=Hydra vulgaris TaxID=6087 RepID=A0ABM4DC94_HYDVU